MAALTVDFRKHSGPTAADDMAAQIITDCGNFTLDFKQHGFCASPLEVFTEDPRPEDPGPDPGPVRVRVYILNGQPGPGRVPIFYFGSRVCLTLCVIPESIGEHRTRQRPVSVSMCVCNLQFVKLGWEKCEREIRWKKKTHALPPQPPETERGRS